MSNSIFRVVGSGRTFLSINDIYVQANTNDGGQVEVVLPNSQLIFNDTNNSNTAYNFLGVRLIDFSNNASVNNIVVYGFQNELINNQQTITLNTNGSGGIFTLIGIGQWSFEKNTPSGGGTVESVTGLNTDNTDPTNPIINISADGTTITGDGTPANPLQAQYIPATNYGLYSQTANSVPITATTSELTLIGTGVGTLSVPENSFSVGDSFVANLYGHISCVGTATIEIRVKSGSTLLADTGIIALDVTTNKHWNFEVSFTIRSLGTIGVGSIVSAGVFSYIKNSGLNFEGSNFVSLNNTTFDTTILNTLNITAQWNTNNAGNNIYSDIFVLNKIY